MKVEVVMVMANGIRSVVPLLLFQHYLFSHFHMFYGCSLYFGTGSTITDFYDVGKDAGNRIHSGWSERYV